jgi:hypothetical protein
MADGMYDEAIVDVVGSESVVSEAYVVKVRASPNILSI